MSTRLILFLAVAGAVAVTVYGNLRTPASIGLKQGRLSPLPSSPNAVSSQTDDAERRVAPLTFTGSREHTRTALLEAIRRYPGRVHIETDTPSYIHCVFISDTFRFRDDVEFLLDEDAGVVHFRSASRVGYSDLGANRRRHETLAALYHRKD